MVLGHAGDAAMNILAQDYTAVYIVTVFSEVLYIPPISVKRVGQYPPCPFANT